MAAIAERELAWQNASPWSSPAATTMTRSRIDVVSSGPFASVSPSRRRAAVPFRLGSGADHWRATNARAGRRHRRARQPRQGIRRQARRGTVNLFTLRPLDIIGFRAVASVKGNGAKDRGAIDPELNLLISNSNSNKTFGVLLAVSSSKYFQRSDLSQGFGFISTPLDTDRNGSKETTALVPQLPRNGVQTFQRDRKALVAAVQLRLADKIRLSAEAMKARVHEDRFRYTIDGFPLLNGAANVP